MNIKERLTSVFSTEFKEGVESTKDMIDSNGTTFDDMAMATNAPGAFSDAEITDAQNLSNEANMSRSDNDPASTCGCEENPIEKATTEITKEIDNLVNISKPEEVPVAIEVTKTTGDVEKEPEEDEKEHDHEHDHEHEHKHEELLKHLFGESKFAEMVEKHLNHKTCEEFLKESFYAGPLDFVPDTRFNVSDVINTLKGKLGDAATGIHVEKGVEPVTEKVYYVVTQIDSAKLPKQITVENTTLTLDGNTYRVDDLSKDFPVSK